MAHQTGCLICGDELVYGEANNHVCSLCGKSFSSSVVCKQGHYICDDCHRIDALEYLYTYVIKTDETNPIVMLEAVMAHPSFNMHGPEHHYLIPAIFLTAICNAGYLVPDNYWTLLIIRCAQLPGGTCGYWGACSSALGAGITTSILTSCTPLSNSPAYSQVHEASRDAIDRIATIGGPRCCKRNTFLAAEALSNFLETTMNIQLPTSTYQCSHMKRNKECLTLKCPFFPKRV